MNNDDIADIEFTNEWNGYIHERGLRHYGNIHYRNIFSQEIFASSFARSQISLWMFLFVTVNVVASSIAGTYDDKKIYFNIIFSSYLQCPEGGQ